MAKYKVKMEDYVIWKRENLFEGSQEYVLARFETLFNATWIVANHVIVKYLKTDDYEKAHKLYEKFVEDEG